MAKTGEKRTVRIRNCKRLRDLLTRIELHEEIKNLPSRQQNVITAYLLKGKKRSEIALDLHRTVSCVQQTIMKAMESLETTGKRKLYLKQKPGDSIWELLLPVELAGFSIKTKRILDAQGIKYIGEILALNARSITRWKRSRKAPYREMGNFLESIDLCLTEKPTTETLREFQQAMREKGHAKSPIDKLLA